MAKNSFSRSNFIYRAIKHRQIDSVHLHIVTSSLTDAHQCDYIKNGSFNNVQVQGSHFKHTLSCRIKFPTLIWSYFSSRCIYFIMIVFKSFHSHHQRPFLISSLLPHSLRSWLLIHIILLFLCTTLYVLNKS
jgi:hypothetical protein